MKEPQREFKAETGDLVAFRTGDSKQVGIVLKREMLEGEEYEHAAQFQSSCDCIKIMWNTPLSAGPRPQPFMLYGNHDDHGVDWYPVYSKAGIPIFTVISTMDDYRLSG